MTAQAYSLCERWSDHLFITPAATQPAATQPAAATQPGVAPAGLRCDTTWCRMPCLRTSRTLTRDVASPLGFRSGSPRRAAQARRQERPDQERRVQAPPSQRREAPLPGEFLRVAASQGGLLEVSHFVELGYEPDAPEQGGVDGKAAWIRRGCPKLNLDAPDESGYTALTKAAANGKSLTLTLTLTLTLALTLILTLALALILSQVTSAVSTI
jgi:hypothetical protein